MHHLWKNYHRTIFYHRFILTFEWKLGSSSWNLIQVHFDNNFLYTLIICILISNCLSIFFSDYFPRSNFGKSLQHFLCFRITCQKIPTLKLIKISLRKFFLCPFHDNSFNCILLHEYDYCVNRCAKYHF